MNNTVVLEALRFGFSAKIRRAERELGPHKRARSATPILSNARAPEIGDAPSGRCLIGAELSLATDSSCKFLARPRDSGSRESGHCWTIIRLPESFAGAVLVECWRSLEAQACDLVLSGFCAPLSPAACASSPRLVQLRRKMSPIRSASRKSDRQWTFSLEAERGFAAALRLRAKWAGTQAGQER